VSCYTSQTRQGFGVNGTKPIVALWRVEALRTIDRLRLTHEISDTEVAEPVRDIQITHETFAIHRVTNQVFQRASETFPTVVGTLDAIHLATALSIREIDNVDLLLTHGSQLGTAARSWIRGNGNGSVKRERFALQRASLTQSPRNVLAKTTTGYF
jgi:hypothetical protein